MLDRTDTKVIERAFEIAANDRKYAGAHIEINGKLLAPYDDEDSEVLAMLAHSQVREKLEEVRDFLTELLDKPAKPVLTPDEELLVSASVFTEHRDSGYLLDVIVHGLGICWLPRPHN